MDTCLRLGDILATIACGMLERAVSIVLDLI
jgi:hypothetical protein